MVCAERLGQAFDEGREIGVEELAGRRGRLPGGTVSYNARGACNLADSVYNTFSFNNNTILA